ncbi:MAG: HPF/RaiA family ribosome-associated protein [Candidatus Binatia bacterium]
MQVPLELTFRGLHHTDDVDAYIREQVAKLHRYCDDFVGCHVTVEHRDQHQRAGNPFRVRIEVSLPPNKYLVATKEEMDNEMHAPLRTVVRSAFEAMERQVKDAVELRRRDVKAHEEPRAIVVRLFGEEGYGFLKTPDDRELYFHRNSVLHGDFDRLTVGTEVRFEESTGEEGPQASTVQITSKQGPVSPGGTPGVDVPRGWR